jgi:hypothetical protein
VTKQSEGICSCLEQGSSHLQDSMCDGRGTGMENTLDIVLDRLFDYAGMFPPAARSFESALRESAELPRALRRPFMLNTDIVLDTAHAHALCDLDLRSFGFTRQVFVALLATSEISDVLAAAQKLHGAHPAPNDLTCRVSSLEIKRQAEGIDEALQPLCHYCKDHNILLAIEPDLSTPEWKDNLEQILDRLSTLSIPCALKCRGSGPTGIGADRLAHALCRVSDVGIPFKVTGGFHHPIVEAELYGNAMGFLNLTVAVMLRRVHGESFPEAQVTDLLMNTDPKAFSWGELLKYGRFSLSRDELRAAKARAPFSIGSCSLAEPDNDLARLFSFL